jgi:hypothetical protein
MDELVEKNDFRQSYEDLILRREKMQTISLDNIPELGILIPA